MTPELILAVLTFIMSLVFDLFPGAKNWWEDLPKETKSWGWLIGCLTIPVGAWMLHCYLNLTIIGEYDCSANGFVLMIVVALAAYGLTQGTHKAIKSMR